MMDVHKTNVLGTSIMLFKVQMVVISNNIVGLPSQAAVL